MNRRARQTSVPAPQGSLGEHVRSGAVVALALLALLGLATIALYAGLWRAGRWQTDEYQLFLHEKLYGLGVLPSRLMFSPRPVSEALIFLYGVTIEWLHKPLVAAFLGLLWGGGLLAIILAARQSLTALPGRWLAACALSLTIFAFILVTSEVTEVFYWPVAAAAYLPVLCAAIVLFFQLAAPLTPRRKLICGVALAVAAASCEVGAALAIGFALCTLLDIALSWAWRKTPPEAPRAWLWWVLPACLGVAVLILVLMVRVNLDEAQASGRSHTGQLFYALAAGLNTVSLDIVAFDGVPGWPSAVVALASRALLALGAALLLQLYGQGRFMPRRHLALAGALAFSALFSTAAAYHDYGTLCCERQSTTRGGFIDLIFIIGACLLLGMVRWRPPGRVWIATSLLALSLSPVLLDVPKIRMQYHVLTWSETARDRSWSSGTAANPRAMQFYLPPDGELPLIRGTGIPVGIYKTDPHAYTLVAAIGRYFGKPRVIVCQPWQSDKSWFVNNKWVLACPSTGAP